MCRPTEDLPFRSGSEWTGLYFRVMLAYLLAMAALWLVGVETIYGHPTPFYALYAPAVTSFTALAWQLPWMVVAAAGLFLFRRFLLPRVEADTALTPRETWRVLGGLFLFAVLFACAVAMIRGGAQGIEQAYDRQSYEYIGDIGKTRNIQQLFARYAEIHEYLSMHAKVHPPGPIALLWMMSYVVGNSPFSLSIATILFGATALFPLFFWTRRLTNQRTALLACVLYSLVPSIVLFTATSADILFTPVTLTTLYLFERAIRGNSIPCALLAGLGYGFMVLLKFSLIGVGAYFGLVGLWMLRKPETRRHVVQTAVLMVAGLAGVLFGVQWWSGFEFDIVETFHLAKAQFDLDQAHLDEATPRLPAWTYRFWNPACWFFFAGIPVSILAIREFLRPANPDLRARWWLFALLLLVLNLLYLARGEGERSALYLFPFLVIPAAHHLGRMLQGRAGRGPVWATVSFLILQCWFIETVFYTYW